MSGGTAIPIRILGNPSISGVTSPSRFPALGYCLIAILSLEYPHRKLRTELASLLWESSAAQSNLRQLIKRMRQAWPGFENYVDCNDREISLRNATSDVDAALLLSTIEIHDLPSLEAILNLYRGRLLDGVQSESQELSQSIELARERLDISFVALVSKGLRNVSRYGNTPTTVLRLAEQQLLAANPDREESYQILIDLYGAVGRREDASRLYSLLKASRRRENEPAPSLKTKMSLVSATSLTLTSVIDHDTKLVRKSVQLPRIALLAPRWIEAGTENNILRLLVEDVANELARYRSFVALAAHSSFQVTHDGGLIDDNSKLRADYTVSSFVRPGSGGLGTLCVRLVNCAVANIVWASEFVLREEALATSFRSIVSRVAAEITRAIEQDALKHLERTGQPSAYLHYLRAQDIMRVCSLQNVRRARKQYAEAVKEDPNFAEAIAGLAICNHFEWLLLGGREPRLLSEGRELAELAIQKDPLSSTGHWRLATISLHQNDFEISEQSFKTAVSLHPNSSYIIIDQADALGHIGDANDAQRLFETAIDLNPMPPDYFWWHGAGIAFSRGDYADAIRLCEKVKDEESVLRLLTACHGQLGNRLEAQSYAQRLRETYPGETAESMTRLQPHRDKSTLQTFIEGLRLAGIK